MCDSNERDKIMSLDKVATKQDCLTQAFFNTTPAEMRNSITADNELEDKTTLAFFVGGESATDQDFIDDYNTRNPNQKITYVGALMERALQNNDILSYGEGVETAHTKNLVSYCFDTVDKSLSDNKITLRVRHEEFKDDDGNYTMKAPDTSTKFQFDQNDTASRAEFETTSDFIHDGNGNPKFKLSLLPIIESQVTKRYKTDGAQAAMNWLKKFTDLVGFDFSGKREKSNINCRRTQPYAVMYTRKDHDGNLILNQDTNKPALFKDEIIPKTELIRGIKPANKIVFMFCLDVNRIFEPGQEGVKITRDNEWEHEHQDHACEFTPGSIKSSDSVTRAEIDAMDDHLKELKSQVMQQHGITESPLSGMNKDARAHFYVTRSKGNDVPLPSQLTLRGRTDNFIVDRIDGFKHLLERSPIIKKAYEEVLVNNKHHLTKKVG
jgi:hypothetical protein